jgi:hypothetical protein
MQSCPFPAVFFLQQNDVTSLDINRLAGNKMSVELLLAGVPIEQV